MIKQLEAQKNLFHVEFASGITRKVLTRHRANARTHVRVMLGSAVDSCDPPVTAYMILNR